jgi:glycolate oxidase iron-sulfur subunit
MADMNSITPDIIVTANTGCILQLRAGVRQSGKKTRVLHVIELLDEAYSKPT